MSDPDLAKKIQQGVDQMVRKLQGMGLTPTFIELVNANAGGCRLCGIEEADFNIQIKWVIPDGTKLGLYTIMILCKPCDLKKDSSERCARIIFSTWKKRGAN